MRELRKSRDKKLFGVAAGMAEYFAIDKTLCRALWVLGCIVVPPVFLAYLILAIVLPSAPAGWSEPPEVEVVDEGPRRPYRRMTKSHDRWLFGVAAGIAEYFEVDPVLVRLLFLVSMFVGGTGLLVYLVLGAIMPRPAYQFR